MEMCESIGFALAQAGKAHRAAIDSAFRALGLHVGQEMVLLQLWQAEGQTQTQLAEQICIEPPTLTRMIQRMEQEQLIVRRTDPEDARVMRVYLSERGRALQSQVEAVWAGVEARTVAGLSREERMLLRRLLIQVQQNLSGEAPA